MNLIPAWKTNHVVLVLPSVFMEYYNDNLTELELFYADFLMEIAKYDRVTCLVPDQVHAEKMARLTQLDLSNFSIATIEDIWIRDFAPIQSEEGYLKFTYNPSYNYQFFNRWLDQSFLNYFNKIQDKFINLSLLNIKMAGCDFIHNGKDTAIIPEKLYDQNPNRTPTEINQLIKERLEIEKLVVIPKKIGESIRHLNSMIRWIDSNHMILNDYPRKSLSSSSLFQKFNHYLEKQLPQVEKVRVPYFYSNHKQDKGLSSEGNSLNFFRTKNRVYLPIYYRQKETKTREIYSQIFGNNISFIDAKIIAKYGGNLNCMTWSYLKKSE